MPNASIAVSYGQSGSPKAPHRIPTPNVPAARRLGSWRQPTMAKKIKRMCKLDKKELEKNFAEFRDLVKEPTNVCEKCARVSRSKKTLCKPIALD